MFAVPSAGLFDEQRRVREDSQPLLAILPAVERPLLLAFFSLCALPRAVNHPEGCSHTVDLADTHVKVKALSQGNLDGRTWGVRSLSAIVLKHRSGLSTELDRMTMSPIFQSSLPLLSEGFPKPISIRLTDLQPGISGRCLPPLALLHAGHQARFCCALLFFVHLFPHPESVEDSFPRPHQPHPTRSMGGEENHQHSPTSRRDSRSGV